MSAESKAVLNRCLEEVWNKGNLAVMAEYYSNAVHQVDPVLPGIRGIEALKQAVIKLRTAFPDIHFTADDWIIEGDKVVGRFTFRGTHKGEFLGVAPTGKHFEVTGTTTHRLAAGKITEAWANWDALGLLRQLGVQTAAQEGTPASSDKDAAAVKSLLNLQYVTATNAGDVAALVSLYTGDAIRMPPNEPSVAGREAIRSWMQAMTDRFTIKIAFPQIEVEVAGDWAFVRGTYTLALTPKTGGERTEDRGKFVDFDKRQPDGSWRIYRDIWNSDKPHPTPGR